MSLEELKAGNERPASRTFYNPNAVQPSDSADSSAAKKLYSF